MKQYLSQSVRTILTSACLIAQTLLAAADVCADDYVLDPKPLYEHGTAHVKEPYKRPEHREACQLYLENLRYFAKRNVPMSCERPIAKSLKNRIARVEWEDLKPIQHPELLDALVAREVQANSVDERQIADWRRAIRNGEGVFRRARLSLTGRPQVAGEYDSLGQEVAFHLVQFGLNVDPSSPNSLFRCKPQRGGSSSSMMFPFVYVVTEDLTRVYGHLSSVADGETHRSILLIDGTPYVEEVFNDADIRLSEILRRHIVILEPVCLYHFQRSTN